MNSFVSSSYVSLCLSSLSLSSSLTRSLNRSHATVSCFLFGWTRLSAFRLFRSHRRVIFFFFLLLCLFWPFNCLRWWYCMVWLCMNVVPWLFSFTVGMLKTIWHLNLLLYVQTFVLIYICIVRIALNECPNMNCNDNKRYPLSNMIQSTGNACGHWKLLWTKLFFSFEL